MELVVVLAILAALATAASMATDHVLLQQRFDLTQETIEDLATATIGPDDLRGVDGTQQVTGFVADVGRVPLAVGNDHSAALAELWSNPRGLLPYAMRQAPTDPEVWVGCGWRGPYLKLPPGASALSDGWGRSFRLWTVADAAWQPAAADTPVLGIESLGSDGQVGVSPDDLSGFGEDLATRFVDPDTAASQWTCDLAITVYSRNSTGDLIAPAGDGFLMVQVFGPDPNTGGVGVVPSPVLTAPFAAPPVVQFADVPVGPHVIRAYATDSGGQMRKSPPLAIQITPRGQAQWQLVLPAAPVAAAASEEEE